MRPRLYRLIEKHQRLDDALRLAQLRAYPDWAEVIRLKKRKLRVKDLIHRLARRPVRA